MLNFNLVRCWLLVLGLAGGCLLSCKGFEAAPKHDGGGNDLAPTGVGSGGRAGTGGQGGATVSGTGGGIAIPPPGTGGAGVGSGGASSGQGTGGAAAGTGSGGAAAGTGGAAVGGGGTASATGGAGAGTGGLGSGSGGAGGGMVACTATQHMCSGSCVENNSIDACGASCDPCKSPAGATATCNGTACDFNCGTGMKKCAAASICVSGSGCCSNADCPAQATGQTGTCDSGTHLCNYSCGANTRACTVGGTTSCLASSACCQDSDCTGTCQTCSAATHTCVAAVSKDDPNGRCAGTCDATGACKSKRGQTCTTTSGGCLAGSSCSPDGYCCDQTCTASCLACDLAGHQGTCTPVSSGAPRGTHAACAGAGTSCGGSCANRSDGACVYPTGSCGSGASCAGGSLHGQSTCNAGSCAAPVPMTCANGCNTAGSGCLTCLASETGCSGTCRNLTTDPLNCGQCGRICAAPSTSGMEAGTHGKATCAGSQCGYTCDTNFMMCLGTTPVCQRKLWDFEDGTTQGFYLRTDITLAESAVVNSTGRAHSGTHALALPLMAAGGQIDVEVPSCENALTALPTSGRTLSAWFYVDGPLDSTQTSALYTGIWGCSNVGCKSSNVFLQPVPTGQWIQMISPVPASFAASWPSASSFSLSGFVYPSGSATTVYIDDITLQ